MPGTNTLAYYNTAKITVVKKFYGKDYRSFNYKVFIVVINSAVKSVIVLAIASHVHPSLTSVF